MTWNTQDKPTIYDTHLLLEIGDALLQETGDYIVLVSGETWLTSTMPSTGTWESSAKPA